MVRSTVRLNCRHTRVLALALSIIVLLSMELFLTRTFYTMIVIYVIALMGDMFPIALRHGALVAALTVGIPAFALAMFAEPGATKRRLLPDVFRVIVPASLTMGVVLLVVYRLFLTLTGDVEMAQAALTATAMLTGLTYILFLQPPIPAMTGAVEYVGRRFPVLLALILLALYVAIAIFPPLNAFFELRTLPLSGYLLIFIVVIGWAAAQRWIWRSKGTNYATQRMAQVWRRLHDAAIRVRHVQFRGRKRSGNGAT